MCVCVGGGGGGGGGRVTSCIWHPGICTYFLLRDFSRLLILLVLHELTVIFV